MNKQTIIMQSILPGTPEWESICKQCGLCCLVKYRDKKTGEIFLTRLACDNLDLNTGKCKCYDPNVVERGDTTTGCSAHDGATLNYQTLENDYVVPVFCPYVQKFIGPIRYKMPDIKLSDCIPQSEATGDIADYAIKNSHTLFKYHNHICKGCRHG